MRAAMRPEFERGRGTGQWHGGPIAAIIDTVGDYALVMPRKTSSIGFEGSVSISSAIQTTGL